METVTKRLYEGMFLVDSAEAARDWDGLLKVIDTILSRSEAEIVSVRKWDERPLAYEIGKVARGTYILAYFRVDAQRIREIEREIKLSERIMRALILSTEQMSEDDIAKDTPSTRLETERQRRQERKTSEDAEQEAAKASEDAGQEAAKAQVSEDAGREAAKAQASEDAGQEAAKAQAGEDAEQEAAKAVEGESESGVEGGNAGEPEGEQSRKGPGGESGVQN